MFFIKRFIVLFFLLIKLHGFSQCFFTNTAFKNGEKIEYDIKYNFGFISIDAGFVSFEVDSTALNGKPVYKFISKGSSYEKYDWIYKVRESYVSYAYCTPLKPISYTRNSLEGSYFSIEQYNFDYPDKKVFSKIQNSNTLLTRDTLPLSNYTYDLLTAIYAFRNFDFEKLQVNQRVPLAVVIDNKCESLYFRMMGKEDFVSNKKKIPCYRIKASMLEGTIFHAGEQTEIWVTELSPHIPIYIEAEILVGTVKAYLKNYKP
jgi:hypothetical protein